MGLNALTQKAGDNSLQIQAPGAVFIQGVTEERVRTIFKEMNAESHTKPAQKIQETTAAISEELCKLDNGNRIKRSILHHAAEIVTEIDKSALCALTVFYILSYFRPNNLISFEGLIQLSNFMKKLLEEGLPENPLWVDHLELLQAVRIIPLWTPRKLSQYYPACVPGYTSIGIKAGSPQHEQAKKILQDAQLPDTCLLENKFLPGYVRIPLPDFYMINNLMYHSVPLTEEQKQACQQVIHLYDTDPSKQEIVNKNFMDVFDFSPVLKKIHTWWDTIPCSFDATPVGLLLANLNARRFEPTIPAYLEE